ncbi:MAG TPA: DUF3332 family protein [Myxococcota bacterium]|nr:DUF3332 family protein [Myxococcota bacterium]
MKNRRVTFIRRVIAVTILCSTSLLVTTGCFGSFTTLHRLYHWNETVDANKWAKWGVFVATVVVPIYPSATLFDMVFTNSVEFWSGRNPMETAEVKTETGEQVSMRVRDDGAVDVAIHSDSQPVTRLLVRPERDSIAAYDEDGKLVARAVEVAPK